MSKKLLPFCYVTMKDITNDKSIFVPYLEGIKGKTGGHKTYRLDTEDYVEMPIGFYKLHKFVRIMADMIFVNGN